MDDLAVVIVSTNEARWLKPCLSTVFESADGLDIDVVVADNSSTDGTRELVESEFPRARVVTCVNRGFGHANNRAYLTTNARYVLFLNPDTEVREGDFGRLLRRLDELPEVGLAGVKQITPDGALFPTMRSFPSIARALGDALGSERLPARPNALGERDLDLRRYELETSCDWTSGSFLIVRREALETAGMFDERFFLFSEETDLCLRIKKAGWEIRHLPSMTILHHAGKAGGNPRLSAQDAFTRRQYSKKHFDATRRIGYLGALGLGYAARSVVGQGARKESARSALLSLLGLRPPPFGDPPRSAFAMEKAGDREHRTEPAHEA